MEQISKRLMNWASILEDHTREQAVTTSRMPFIHPHLALMPDAHLGKGATVGCVIPTLGAIIPAAVGVDIGCGMMAVRTAAPRRRPARRTGRLLHAAISAADPAVGRQVQRDALLRGDRRRGSRRSEAMAGVEQAAGDRAELAPAAGLARARATTSSRSASTRPTRSGCSCTPARAASATSWRMKHIRVAQAAVREALDQPAGPGPGLPGRGRAGVLVLHGGAALGAAVRAA